MSLIGIRSIVDHWITDFDLQAVRDILLEGLAFVAFLFLLIVLIIAMARAPILISRGSLEIFIFVLLGLTHSVMNVIDEFAWITNYNYWKLSKEILLLTGAVLLVIGFFRFFIFSARLFGEDTKSNIEASESIE
jgi:hypothetical protein